MSLEIDIGSNVHALQDLGPYSQWWWENTRISTDTVPGLGPCAVRWLARSFVKGGSPAVYTYLFAHPAQVDIPNIPGTGPHSVVVPHASEIAVSGAIYTMSRLQSTPR
jgi:hypothetical protein